MEPTQQGIKWATTANGRETQLLAIVDELRTQVQQLQQGTEALRTQIQVLQQRNQTTTRQVLPAPDDFSGRAKDWDTWSMAMRAKLRIDGGAIGSGEAQFYYVYNSLEPKVQSLMLSFVRQAQEQENWEPLALLDYLGRTYDDPHKAKKAGQRLMELKQGTTPIAQYIPQFERTMFEAGAGTWPDDAKITTLVGGLNKYTRQRLDGQLVLPTEYDKFVRTLQILGNQFGPSFFNGQNNSNDNGNAMEWQTARVAAVATKAAPAVSKDQRQTWRDDGKCVRCGSSKHWVNRCPLQPTHSRSSSVSSNSPAKPLRVNTVRTKTTAKPSFVVNGVPSNRDNNDNDSDDSSDPEIDDYNWR
jgi:Retrotransposon gag protein